MEDQRPKTDSHIPPTDLLVRANLPCYLPKSKVCDVQLLGPEYGTTGTRAPQPTLAPQPQPYPTLPLQPRPVAPFRPVYTDLNNVYSQRRPSRPLVTVLNFPSEIASPETLFYQPPIDESGELGNRNPPEAVIPAGIVQSTQPRPTLQVFLNSKEHPLLQSLRDEAENNRDKVTANSITVGVEALIPTIWQAIVVVASTPVNCLLPMMSQLLAKNGCYDHNKVLGTTTVDTVRASALLASRLRLDPREVVLPVIGGSSENSRVPVFSQARPFFSIKPEIKSNLITEIRRGDSIVLANKGSPEVLNRAHSTVRFLNSIMSGLNGQSNVTDITLCRTDLVPGVDYFSLPVVFGKEGIVKRFGVPKTTSAEDEMIDEAIKQVKKDSDRAAFIVRRALELPEYNFSSISDRSSTQKELFDLYVKCLPKPENDTKSTSSGHKSNPDEYSFRTLIDAEAKPVADPFDIPENKSFQKMVRNNLKSVSSEESLLKSTGFYNSPLQRPIVILEPLNCPSKPFEASSESNLDKRFEETDKVVLHEKHLAQASQLEAKENNVGGKEQNSLSQTPKPVPKSKVVDPIAKFKAQVSKPTIPEAKSRPNEPVASHRKKSSKTDKIGTHREMQFTHNKRSSKHPVKSVAHNPRTETYLLSEKSMQKESSKYARTHNQSSSTREECQGVEEREENIANKKYLEAEDFEDAEEDLDVLYHYRSKPKLERFEPAMTLLDKADSLAEGLIFPKNTYYTESANSHNRRVHFRESAVKSRSRNNSSHHIIPFKSPFKLNFDDTSIYDAGTGENYQNGVEVAMPRKPPPKSKPIQSGKRKTAGHCRHQNYCSEHNQEHGQERNEVVVHVVCPKCQNELACQSGKGVQSKNADTNKSADCTQDRLLEVEESGKTGNCEQCGNQALPQMMDSRLNQTNRPNKLKNASYERQKDQRLKKLKEKINQKLIPLLSSTRQPSSSINIQSRIDCGSKDAQANSRKITEERLPRNLPDFTDNREEDNGIASTSQPTSERKWQGVPFVIKAESEEQPRNYTNEEPKSMQSNIGSRNSASLKEKHLFKVPFSIADPKEELQLKDEMANVRNKLQLLVSKANHKIRRARRLEDKKVSEKEELKQDDPARHSVKASKVTRRLRAADLGLDNVRNYMLAKTKESNNLKITDIRGSNDLTKNGQHHDDNKPASELKIEQVPSKVQPSPEKIEEATNSLVASGSKDQSCTKDEPVTNMAPSTKNKHDSSSQVEAGKEKKVAKTTEETHNQESGASIKRSDVNELESRNAGEPGSKTVEAFSEGQSRTGNSPDRYSKTEGRSAGTMDKKTEAETTLVEKLKPHSRKKNKLQLLAELKRHELKGSKTPRFNLHKLNSKAAEITTTAPPKANLVFRGDERISAAVKIAQKRGTRKKMEKLKVKSTSVEKPLNILEGLAFPPKKAQKAKVHPRSLLKELSSAAARRKSAVQPEETKPKNTFQFKRRSVDPSRDLNFSKTLEPHRSQKFSRMFPSSGRYSEYTRDEEEFARLASEVIMKRELRIPKIGKPQNEGPIQENPTIGNTLNLHIIHFSMNEFVGRKNRRNRPSEYSCGISKSRHPEGAHWPREYKDPGSHNNVWMRFTPYYVEQAITPIVLRVLQDLSFRGYVQHKERASPLKR
ncbi:unnamed protein product [Nesidiocoris tenuis]|uniref:Lactate/malate dehydrogenase C-terminal domain-containing protein n=1 Tax=Nesidiocoris tenuis TaxID=355587 RepID=A0A6H5H3N3_9HEMI|nr:unnamed protein product [Nesidiocoris tenuis]